MAITFDKDKGLIASSALEVKSDVEAVWQSAFESTGKTVDTSPTTIQGQLITSETASVVNKDNEILYLANQFNLNTADDIFLDALAKIYFIERQQALPTIVTCTCVGLQNVLIPQGAIVATDNNVQLRLTEGVSIGADGTTSAIFETVETGAIIINANTVINIVTQIPGWDSVDNQTAGVTGRIKEPRVTFIRRIKNSVAINAVGTVNALYANIANVSGVVALNILENDTTEPLEILGVTIPPHSICISVFGGDNSAIAETIYLKKDAGCGTFGNTEISYTDSRYIERKYNIYRPTPTAIAVEVDVVYNVDLPGSVETLVKQAVLNNFNGETGLQPVQMAQTLYSTRFISDILAVGVTDLASVKVAFKGGTPAESIDLLVTQMPTLNADDIKVNIDTSQVTP